MGPSQSQLLHFLWFVQNTEFAFDIDQKNGGSLED